MNLKKKFILFTKSYWNEPPRIRHQLARLLLANNHQIFFFEKPDLLTAPNFNQLNDTQIETSDIFIKRTKQLIHHQLRISNFLRYSNAKYEKISIHKNINIKEHENSIIINFNYDYYFLRDIFPQNKIITIINDDFVAQSKINKGRHVLHVLEKTCKNSDAVFVVSYPLAKQVENWCKPEIFFPWAPSRYRKPNNNTSRKSILFWGYINQRVDFELLIEVATQRPEILIDIYGPISSDARKETSILEKNFNQIKFYNSVTLNGIDFDKYFCSIIPYKNDILSVKAISVANKTFQLMSMGLPIVTHGMPNFIDNKAIFKTNTKNHFIQGIDNCFFEFYNLQASIENLVNNNQSKDRYNQMMNAIKF